jgi:hypothetical protein
MPVIRVSDEVMEILKKFAIPLKDTPDTVLKRILKEYVILQRGKKGELEENSKLPSRLRKGISLGETTQRYGRWIIASLKSLGGRARAREVLINIEKLFGNEFSEDERQPLKSGTPRWRKNVYSARGVMVKQGLLKKTKYGIWELV